MNRRRPAQWERWDFCRYYRHVRARANTIHVDECVKEGAAGQAVRAAHFTPNGVGWLARVVLYTSRPSGVRVGAFGEDVR